VGSNGPSSADHWWLMRWLLSSFVLNADSRSCQPQSLDTRSLLLTVVSAFPQRDSSKGAF
jgi:hypothetical protein